MGLREAEKRILELAERGVGTEDMVERLGKRVGSMEESKRQMVWVRESSSQRRSRKIRARDRGSGAMVLGG